MENKITKRQALETIHAMLNGTTELPEGFTTELLDGFVLHELELLDKKNMARKEISAEKAQEDERFMDLITSFLDTIPEDAREIGGVTCAEILRNIPEFMEAGYATSKVVSILKKLREAGRVLNTKKGNKSLYMLA